MNLFHILTIIISIVVFLGLFIYTMVIYYNDIPTIFPKDMTSCPDFWTVNPNGTCQIPTPGPKDEPAVNVGLLTRSQKEKHVIYNYEQKNVADDSGTYIDLSLTVPNKSYLPSYNDPGNILQKTPTGMNFSPNNVRNPGKKTYSTSGSEVYRYDIHNYIPAGYSISDPGNIDFNDYTWGSYGDPYCAIQSWVKENGIVWDSVMAYNKC